MTWLEFMQEGRQDSNITGKVGRGRVISVEKSVITLDITWQCVVCERLINYSQ